VVYTPDSYREALGSNLGPETGHPDWRFSWFSCPHRQMLGQYLKIRPLSVPSTPFHSSYLHSTPYRLRYWMRCCINYT
jgi:hypothetical protein